MSQLGAYENQALDQMSLLALGPVEPRLVDFVRDPSRSGELRTQSLQAMRFLSDRRRGQTRTQIYQQFDNLVQDETLVTIIRSNSSGRIRGEALVTLHQMTNEQIGSEVRFARNQVDSLVNDQTLFNMIRNRQTASTVEEALFTLDDVSGSSWSTQRAEATGQIERLYEEGDFLVILQNPPSQRAFERTLYVVNNGAISVTPRIIDLSMTLLGTVIMDGTLENYYPEGTTDTRRQIVSTTTWVSNSHRDPAIKGQATALLGRLGN